MIRIDLGGDHESASSHDSRRLNGIRDRLRLARAPSLVDNPSLIFHLRSHLSLTGIRRDCHQLWRGYGGYGQQITDKDLID